MKELKNEKMKKLIVDAYLKKHYQTAFKSFITFFI